jgi:hypothetical protein
VDKHCTGRIFFSLVFLFQARKCHGCRVVDNKLYVVGGTDCQRAVMTSEYLDLTKALVLAPARAANDRKSLPVLMSTWVEVINTLPTWHNGSAGLISIGHKTMAALSVYGTDNDKIYNLDTK